MQISMSTNKISRGQNILICLCIFYDYFSMARENLSGYDRHHIVPKLCTVWLFREKVCQPFYKLFPKLSWPWNPTSSVFWGIPIDTGSILIFQEHNLESDDLTISQWISKEWIKEYECAGKKFTMINTANMIITEPATHFMWFSNLILTKTLWIWERRYLVSSYTDGPAARPWIKDRCGNDQHRR